MRTRLEVGRSACTDADNSSSRAGFVRVNVPAFEALAQAKRPKSPMPSTPPLHAVSAPVRLCSPVLLRLLLIALGLGFFGYGFAQSLSYSEAIALAQERDPEFRAARIQRRSADESVTIALSQLLPNASLSVGRSQATQEAQTPSASGAAPTTTQQFASNNTNVQVRQAVLRRREWLQYQQSKVGLEVAEAVLQQQRRALAQRLNAAILEAEITRLQLAQQRRQLAFQRLDFLGTERRLREGFVSALDAEAAKLRVEQAMLGVLQTEEAVELADMRVASILGTTVGDRIALPPGIQLVEAARLGTLEERLQRSLLRHPDIQALQKQIEVALIDVARNDSGHWPTVDAIASYTDSTSEFALNRGYSYKTTSLGLQLILPLYAGGAITASTRQARQNVERLEELLESTRRRVRLETEADWRREQQTLRTLDALQAQLNLAKVELQAAEQRLRAGFSSSLDVTAARLRVEGVETTIASTQLQLLSAFARVQRGY